MALYASPQYYGPSAYQQKLALNLVLKLYTSSLHGQIIVDVVQKQEVSQVLQSQSRNSQTRWVAANLVTWWLFCFYDMY